MRRFRELRFRGCFFPRSGIWASFLVSPCWLLFADLKVEIFFIPCELSGFPYPIPQGPQPPRALADHQLLPKPTCPWQIRVLAS